MLLHVCEQWQKVKQVITKAFIQPAAECIVSILFHIFGLPLGILYSYSPTVDIEAIGSKSVDF